jgi:hypothetical protein
MLHLLSNALDDTLSLFAWPQNEVPHLGHCFTLNALDDALSLINMPLNY